MFVRQLRRRLFLIGAAVVLAAGAASTTAVAQTNGVSVYYSPEENLELRDVALLRSARRNIDIAAYVLTDFPVMDALADAAKRGVAVRILTDQSQIRDDRSGARLTEVSQMQNVEVRIRPRGGSLMHLKSYVVDGEFLRTGSANFSASGLKRQENDLVLIHDRGAAKRFLEMFEEPWNGAKHWVGE